MATAVKYDFAAAVAFASQTGEGTYNSTLDTISATLTAANGYILGQNGTGIGNSGLTIGLGREYEDKTVEPGSLTRAISNFTRASVPTFTFAFPFCGNRADCSDPPVDGDFDPITGMDALLQAVGLTGSAWGSGVGHSYVFGSPNPISALVYINGIRLELLDCRASSLSIVYTAGSVPVATATLAVGSIKDVSVAALPGTLTPGEQGSVSAPIVESVANTWQNTRGFSELTIDIEPSIADVGDSNAADGIVKEIEDRVVSVSGTLYSDSTGSYESFDYDQIIEEVEGNLVELTFQVGSDGTANNPAKAHSHSFPLLELHVSDQDKLGSRAATTIEGVARGAAGGGGNDEMELIFR